MTLIVVKGLEHGWGRMGLRSMVLLAIVIGASACSRQNSIAITDQIADQMLRKQRDDVIRNWQARLRNEPGCERFRDEYWREGRRYPSSASGSFVLAMQRVRESAAAAGCVPGASDSAPRVELTGTRSDRRPAAPVAYRWKDAAGQWHLADQPPASGIEYEEIPLRR